MSALFSLVVGVFIVGPAIAFLIALVHWLDPEMSLYLAALTIHDVFEIGELSEFWWIVVPPFLLIVGAGSLLPLVWRERALDLVIDRGGIVMEGGRHHGLTIAWTDLNLANTRTEDHDGRRTLILERRSESGTPSRIEIADGVLDDERQELDVVAATLRALDDVPAVETPQRIRGDVPRLACPTCREPAAPDDEETVRCRQCLESIAVPDALRARIVADRVQMAKRAGAVAEARDLFNRAGAHAGNTLLALAGVVALIAWPAAWAALLLQGARGTLTVFNVIFLGIGVSVVIAAPMWFAASRLTSRTALQRLTLELSVRLTRGASGMPVCRCCGALLPVVRDDAMLVLCVHCHAENLFVLPLHGAPSGRKTKTITLNRTLKEWRQYSRAYRTCALITLVLFPGAAWAISAGLKPMTAKTAALDGCRQKQWPSCVRAGELEEADAGVETGDRAMAFYDQACRATADLGCFELARMLREGRRKVRLDHPRALKLFTALCDRRHRADACRSEGIMYLRGEGVAADHTQAYTRLARACDGGDALGCLLQGAFLADGETAPKDAARAATLYRRACDGGSHDGCLALADALETGTGIDKNIETARRLRQAACDRGSHAACSFVADALLTSNNADDRARGTRLLRQGCNSGFDGRSCWRLGRLYAEGRLTETDYDTAAKYLSMGCNLGLRESCADAAARTSTGPPRTTRAP